MIGSIIGDIVGAPYEYSANRNKNFRPFFPKTRFTDDSIHTIAICEWLCSRRGHTAEELISILQQWYLKYPDAEYGGMFRKWVNSNDLHTPYNSYGNGAAMRAVPIGLYAQSEWECLNLAEISASVTHNHPEGIKGAKAAAYAVYLMKTLRKEKKSDKDAKIILGMEMLTKFDYSSEKVPALRAKYEYDDTCQGTVPQAIMCFLESISFKDAVRNAASIGGDADTLAAITGAIAEAWYGIPMVLHHRAAKRLHKLDPEMYSRLKEFYATCKNRTREQMKVQKNFDKPKKQLMPPMGKPGSGKEYHIKETVNKQITPAFVFGIIEDMLLGLPQEINSWEIRYGTDGATVPEFVITGPAFAGGICVRMDHLENDLQCLNNKVAFAIGETIRRRKTQETPEKETEKDELPF